MNDKELLELAAKACGELTPSWYGNDAYFNGVLQRWNPLTNDGDALRLAVKLGLTISVSIPLDGVMVDTHTEAAEEQLGNDPYAATRRAIVRCAAEIGRNMK